MTGRAKKISGIRGPPAPLPASSSPLFLHPHSTSDILPAFFRRRAHQVQRARQDHGEGGGVDGGAGALQDAGGFAQGGAGGAHVVHEEKAEPLDPGAVRRERALEVSAPPRGGEALLRRRGLAHPQPAAAGDPHLAGRFEGHEPRGLEAAAEPAPRGAGHVHHGVPPLPGPASPHAPRHRAAEKAAEGIAEAVLVKQDEVAHRTFVHEGAGVGHEGGRVGQALAARVGALAFHGRQGDPADRAGRLLRTPSGAPAGPADPRCGPAPAVASAEAARAGGQEEVEDPSAGGASPHGRLGGHQGDGGGAAGAAGGVAFSGGR